MSERIVLAYSGGLDTSVCIGWLAEETGQEVVAVAVDVGQGGEDMEVIRQRALDCGAVEAVVIDAKDAFVAAFTSGLRLGAVVVLGAAFVAWRYLPARAHDPLVVPETADQPTDDGAATAVPVAGD